MVRGWGWTAALGVAAILVVSCNAILGDDFHIVDTTVGTGASTTTAATGGATSSSSAATGAGGSGGIPVPPPVLSCSWELPNHQLVRSLQGTSETFAGPMLAARRDAASMRVFVRHYPGGIDVWTVGTNITTPTVATFPGYTLLWAGRLWINGTGALYVDTATSLKLRVVPDSDTGDGYEEILEDMFPGAPTGLDSARMTVVSADINGFEVDFIAGYTDPTTSKLVEAYGRWDSTTSTANTVIITPGSVTLSSQEVWPVGIVHADGQSYGFFGQYGTREYVLDGQGAVGAARPLEPDTSLYHAVVPGDDPSTANFAVFDVATSVRLLVGQVASADLATFEPAQAFHTCFDVPSLGDMPVVGGFLGFQGDIATMVGYPATDETLMRYRFCGMDGADRGAGDLPFTATLQSGETRSSIEEVAVAPADVDFADSGGTLHVLWYENHELNTETFDVMYYDRLRCVPVE